MKSFERKSLKELKIVAVILAILLATFSIVLALKPLTDTSQDIASDKAKQIVEEEVAEELPAPFLKPMEDKEAVMEAEIWQMDALGLYYDYPNMTLPEVVQAYLDEIGMPYNSVAFSYKNLETGELISMNETQPMTAGSTYKLPLNMLIVDGVADGTFSMDEAYDISQITYENEQEYLAYLGQFGSDMTIAEMQQYSLVYSENTPALGMVQMLGGFEKVTEAYEKYGSSKSDIKTIQLQGGNKTTSDYYIQVMDYLWHNQERYEDILYYIGLSFPDQYYKAFWPYLEIYQKPGFYAEALNVGAIVYEETPYLIAIFTAGLGGANAETTEVNDLGYVQMIRLTYVINEWHRVNQNP